MKLRTPAYAKAFLLSTLLSFSSHALAAELIMFTRNGCAYCLLWDKQIGPIYSKTDEAIRAPLKKVNLDSGNTTDPILLEAVSVTPTFVLIDQGREIGRFAGYSDDLTFWSQLSVLLKKLDPIAGSRMPSIQGSYK